MQYFSLLFSLAAFLFFFGFLFLILKGNEEKEEKVFGGRVVSYLPTPQGCMAVSIHPFFSLYAAMVQTKTDQTSRWTG